MEIKIYNIVDTDTLRHRESAQMILQIIAKEPVDSQVVLDFTGIIFASRTFLHEMLSGLRGRELKIINVNADVESMIQITFNKPQIILETSDEIKGLNPTHLEREPGSL